MLENILLKQPVNLKILQTSLLYFCDGQQTEFSLLRELFSSLLWLLKDLHRIDKVHKIVVWDYKKVNI